jgi:hypothetical protein
MGIFQLSTTLPTFLEWKSRIRIKPRKVKYILWKSVQGQTPQNNTNIEYCSTENLGGKIQFMIWSGALLLWARFSHFFTFRLLDFRFLWCSAAWRQQEKKSISALFMHITLALTSQILKRSYLIKCMKSSSSNCRHPKLIESGYIQHQVTRILNRDSNPLLHIRWHYIPCLIKCYVQNTQRIFSFGYLFICRYVKKN